MLLIAQGAERLNPFGGYGVDINFPNDWGLFFLTAVVVYNQNHHLLCSSVKKRL
ncbi:MAG: hypothetical protein RL394_18 [Bacteroidota bacterium]|jgi:hypothetical protein